MKKTTAVIASAMLLTSYNASADAIGVYAGAQVWNMAADGGHGKSSADYDYNYDDEVQNRFYISVEHPIPFIPNAKLAYSELKTDSNSIEQKSNFSDFIDGSSDIDFSYIDYTLYYEILDNDLVSLDLGVTAKDFEGDLDSAGDFGFNDESVDEIIPMLYASVKVGLPFTGLNAFAEGNFLSFDDTTFTDYQVGIQYELIDNMLIDVSLSAGYRVVNLDLDDVDNVNADIDFDGAFAGVEFHF